MERLTDAIIVLVLCIPLVVSECSIEAAVAYLLVAIVFGCLCFLGPPSNVCLVIVVLFVAGCAFAPGMYTLSPFAAYMCMCQRPWLMRLIWLIPFCVALWLANWHAYSAIAVLCVIGSVLAVRTVRNEVERKGMRAVRDGLREQAIELSNTNRTLKEELAASDPDNACDVCGYEGELNISAFADLTDREQAVVGLIAEGFDNREIAGRLYLSEGTVRNHISSILQKKQLKNRTQIAIMYYRG